MPSDSERRGLRLGDARLSFSFDGRRYDAQQGDTASSALLAHGVRLMGRSVKARRRRGVLTCAPEEPNALVSVGKPGAAIPNIPATQLVLSDGLVIRSQNRWPSLRFDLASLLQAGGGVFSAGFYYKTFIWPSWRTYEPLIRSLAGLGEGPQACDLPPPAVEHLNCDVLVAGGGPAGLLAALAAQRAGARVVICEREPSFGGELEFETAVIDGHAALVWVSAVVAELKARGSRLLLDTAVVGGRGGQLIAHFEPGGLPGHNTLYRIRPRAFVIAMGAVERPLVFTNNDRPGVMMLGAAERYLARYGVRVGAEVVIFANHNRAYLAAARLQAAGVGIRAIVDTRREVQITKNVAVTTLRRHLIQSGIECLCESAVVEAKGRAAVTSVEIRAHASSSLAHVVACDTLLISGGWTPATHAALQEGGTGRYVSEIAAFVADQQPQWRVSVGAANGTLELDAICAEAFAAGSRAARIAGVAAPDEHAPNAAGDPAPCLVPFWRARAACAAEKRQFVDFQTDVTVADLRTAVEEGFSDVEHAKRYTALGFGTDQGRLSGLLGAAIVAELRGESLETVGTSLLRQPYHPVTMRSLAGLRTGNALRVARRTPLHDWHSANGAVLESSGLWMRPRYYLQNGTNAMAASIVEAKRVRTTGGIADASTLGKIEFAGSDAAAFLDYVYMTPASSLRVGRSRYVVALREDGMVLDDGILLRLAPNLFRATTSTGHAGAMLSHFEYYRASEWENSALAISDVTDAWAVIAVAGPRARDAVVGILDASTRAAVVALRHMDFTTAQFCATALIVLRATFSGELGYEFHCRPHHVRSLWEALIAARLSPYGLDALDILRVEKGYLTHAELSGQTTPYDLGMQTLRRSDNYVGRDLLDRPAFHDPSRPRLIGVRAADGRAFLAGAQLVTPSDRSRPCGYVTSSAFSPALNEWIGLALVARAIPEGAELTARDPVRHGDTTIRLWPSAHFDPTGQRMRG